MRVAPVEIMVHNIINTIGIKHYEIIVVNSGSTEISNIKNLANVSIYDMDRQGAPQGLEILVPTKHMVIFLYLQMHIVSSKKIGIIK